MTNEALKRFPYSLCGHMKSPRGICGRHQKRSEEDAEKQQCRKQTDDDGEAHRARFEREIHLASSLLLDRL